MSDEGESKPEQAAKPEAEEESEEKIEEQSISESKVDEKPVESETQSDNQVAKTEENTPSQDFAAYEEHMTYASDGGAIYTDPSTKQKYKWCTTQNNWQPLSADEAASAGDLYENEHYPP